jgi:HTH-type transcriptional regulator/antitoxin HipB
MTSEISTIEQDSRDRAAMVEFASQLRSRRRSLGLRQDELADLAEVSERFIFALEHGKASVQLDKLLAVLNALGLHLEVHRGSALGITSARSATK